MKKHLFKISAALIIIVLVVLFYKYNTMFSTDEKIYMAVVGPMSGPDEAKGQEMVRGVNMLLEKINNNGGINGNVVQALVFDDKNDHQQAINTAVEMVKDKKNLAVLGHYGDEESLLGGPIYKEAKVPVITATAEINDITEDNEWYFRITHSNRSKAHFLAHYAHEVLNHENASIIYDEGDTFYSSEADVFKKAFEKTGGEILFYRSINSLIHGQERITTLVDELSNRSEGNGSGVIFLALSDSNAAQFVVAMKRKEIDILLMSNDQNIQEELSNEPEEKKKKGYFSDGIYSVIYTMSSLEGEEARSFETEFKKKYGTTPSPIVIGYYEAALVAVEAMKNVEITGQIEKAAQERQEIRDYLASLTTINQAIDGLTGPLYFDESRTLKRPPKIGIFEWGMLRPALTEFNVVKDVQSIVDLDQEIQSDHILKLHDQYLYITQIVHTGIEIHSIKDFNSKDFTYSMDFSLSFRFSGENDVGNIEFLNAITPIKQISSSHDQEIESIVLKEEQSDGSTSYRIVAQDKDVGKMKLTKKYISPGKRFHLYRYRVQGRFKADFIDNPPGRHILGVSFRHRELSQNNLLYIGYENDFTYPRNLTFPGWEATIPMLKRESDKKDILVMMSLGHFNKVTVDFSRLNAGIWIKEKAFPIQRITSALVHKIPAKRAQLIMIMTFIVILILLLLKYKPGRVKIPLNLIKWLLLITVIASLISVERVLQLWLNTPKTLFYLYLVIITFEIIWFIFPAYILTLLIDYLVWFPLEKSTSRKVPRVLRRNINYLIYIVAFLCVLKFVLERDVMSLAATSGALAILFALTNKVDISNISAGIQISLAQPFRIGDWIKIGSYEEGQVMEMTSRSTKVKTRNNSLISIANTDVLTSPIENYSYPDPRFRLIIHLETVPDYRFERVEKVLLDAVASTNGVLKDPKPQVFFHGQGDSAQIYEVVFYISDYSKKVVLWQAAWRRIWRHLEQAHIILATPQREIAIIDQQEETASEQEFFLRGADVLQGLPDDVITSLSKKALSHTYQNGEIILDEDDTSPSLFIITEGSVGVWYKFQDGNRIEISRLGVGNCFGLLELLPEDAQKTKFKAASSTHILEIKKEHIAPLIKSHPHILEFMDEKFSKRQLNIKIHRDLYKSQKESRKKSFIEKLEGFFK